MLFWMAFFLEKGKKWLPILFSHVNGLRYTCAGQLVHKYTYVAKDQQPKQFDRVL